MNLPCSEPWRIRNPRNPRFYPSARKSLRTLVQLSSLCSSLLFHVHCLHLTRRRGMQVHYISALVLTLATSLAFARDLGVDVSHFQGSTGISQTSWNQMAADGK